MTPEQTREAVVHLMKLGRVGVLTELLGEIDNRREEFTPLDLLGLGIALKLIKEALRRDVSAEVVEKIMQDQLKRGAFTHESL